MPTVDFNVFSQVFLQGVEAKGLYIGGTPASWEAGAAPSLWTPASLPGLRLWLDADDPQAIETDSNGRVASWNDKSGAGLHATPADPSAPLVGSLNGRTAVDIPTNHALTFPAPGIVGDADRTIFMVVGPGNELDTDNRAFLTMGTTGATGGRYCWRERGNQFRVELNGSGFTQGSSDPDGVIGLIHSGPTLSGTVVWRDGVVNAADGGTSTVATVDEPGFIGRNSSSNSGQYSGLVGEVILCAAALSTADRQKVEGYLAHKWSYAGPLDAAHPYKSSAPLS